MYEYINLNISGAETYFPSIVPPSSLSFTSKFNFRLKYTLHCDQSIYKNTNTQYSLLIGYEVIK